MFYIIFFGFLLLSWLVQSRLKSKFKEFSKIPVSNNLSGKDVAEKMIQEHGLYDVKVTCVEGQLTDHYNPLTKAVNLSSDVYYGQHVSAAAVAAHECGHAVQHARAYAWLNMRSKLVPVVSFTSNWVQWILFAGVLLITVFPYLLLFGIVLFAFTAIFSFITLPVEIDASRRALIWLNSAGITSHDSYPKAKEALRLAAYTYVIAALFSLAMLMHYLMIYLRRS